jgi:hypothetical protein
VEGIRMVVEREILIKVLVDWDDYDDVTDELIL